MEPNQKRLKLYPGQRRIILALADAPLKFNILMKEANLSRAALSKYLKELEEHGFVAHNKETRQYYLPRALQPLNPSSFPISWQAMHILIEDIKFYGDFISGLKDPAERLETLTKFFHIHFSLLAANLVQVINEACGYEDPHVADEFVQRSLEFYFTPWIHLLSLACFRSKEISDKPMGQVMDTFMKIAESMYEGFLKGLPEAPMRA